MNRDGVVHWSQTSHWCRQADPVSCIAPNSPPSFPGQQQGGKENRGKTSQPKPFGLGLKMYLH